MNRYKPTLFDRLMDDDGPSTQGHVLRGIGIEQIKDGVARDLEALLNTRTAFSESSLFEFPKAFDSVLSFGLVDFVGKSLERSEDRAWICRSIEQAIARHEPRLRNVTVSLARPDGRQQTLHFAVIAMLVLDPSVEPVSFEATLQPMTQKYAVSHAKLHAVPAAA